MSCFAVKLHLSTYLLVGAKAPVAPKESPVKKRHQDGVARARGMRETSDVVLSTFSELHSAELLKASPWDRKVLVCLNSKEAETIIEKCNQNYEMLTKIVM